jgi:hypothetical protein
MAPGLKITFFGLVFLGAASLFLCHLYVGVFPGMNTLLGQCPIYFREFLVMGLGFCGTSAGPVLLLTSSVGRPPVVFGFPFAVSPGDGVAFPYTMPGQS